MATVFQKKVTRKMPADAERFVRKGAAFVRYRSKGKIKTAKVIVGKDGTERITVSIGTYLAKYRDARGLVCEVSTGCRDEDAARSVLADLIRREELIRGNVITREEAVIADHRATSLADHLADYVVTMQSAGRSQNHIHGTKRMVMRLIDECKFILLQDVRREPMERWLVERQKENMAARTRNSYRQALNGFLNWCIQCERLATNPLARVAKADENSDRRKTRRAMTEAELNQLLRVARDRPLAEYGRFTVSVPKTTKKRAHWTYEPLTMDTLETCRERARERLNKNTAFIAMLERRGRERMLVYKTMVLTGLRCNELRSITRAQLLLDDAQPAIDLAAKDEKNRDGTLIPLRSDLADDLRTWIADEETREASGNVLNLPATKGTDDNRSVFYVADGLVKILDADLETAGIPKVDNRGRSLDVHALRTTFGTLLSRSGVAPRTAQAAMRHSRIDLTMNVYTDPRLLDVSGAVGALPTLNPTEAKPVPGRATGTHDQRSPPAQLSRNVAPTVSPKSVQASQNMSLTGNLGVLCRASFDDRGNEKTPQNTGFRGVFNNDADGARTRNLRIDSSLSPRLSFAENPVNS